MHQIMIVSFKCYLPNMNLISHTDEQVQSTMLLKIKIRTIFIALHSLFIVFQENLTKFKTACDDFLNCIFNTENVMSFQALTN